LGPVVALRHMFCLPNRLSTLEILSATVLSPPSRAPLGCFVRLLALRLPIGLGSPSQRRLLDLLRPLPPREPPIPTIVLPYCYALLFRCTANLKVGFSLHMSSLPHDGCCLNWRHTLAGRCGWRCVRDAGTTGGKMAF
jgi:hypothetical protein